MAESFESTLRSVAKGRCEYCLTPESASRLKHVVDHIIARQHGGATEFGNLAFCCGRCNQFKGPNIAGLDPLSRDLVRLFNPRRDRWADHFQYMGAVLVGLTPMGRATAMVLAINVPLRIAARQALLDTGAF